MSDFHRTPPPAPIAWTKKPAGVHIPNATEGAIHVSLVQQSQKTVAALLGAIEDCADSARTTGSADDCLAYARAAESLGAALADYTQWNTPPSSRSSR